ARDAAARPLPGAHSIWELVLHMTAWTHEVRRRLGGAPPGTPPEGDWPPVGDAGDSGWAATLAELDRAHAALAAAVAPLSEQALARPVGDGREPTVAATLAGLAQHDAYHTGQIAILRRALGKKS
ncbi:MAG TPA: DinB family protein, partial [Gemmatimonadaceae bacterium]|nr:DinB family protein [Gemmatimonadaceae bacterium]